MKKRTRALVAIGIVVGLPVVALAVLPMVLGDRIASRAKVEANNAVNARIDWRDAGLSLFGDFPNLTLTLDDLSVAGVGTFAGDTLAVVRNLAVVLDLGSVIGNLRNNDPLVIRSVELERPRVALRVLENGTANWNIAKDAPSSTASPSPLRITLKQLEIRDARLTLDDRQTKLTASIAGFRQLLSGDFGQDRFVLETSTHADSVSLEFAGVPYLTRVALDIGADLDADMRSKKFTFRKNEIRLNDLLLALTGSVTVGEDRTSLDLAFNAPRTEFRHILSLVPAIYARDFQKVRTSGAFRVAGNVKGDYGETAFPSFVVDARVDDAAFQYPDLPLPARDIAFALSIRNPGGSADSTVVRLDRFHARIGPEPIDGALTLRTPVSDPDVDLRLTGKIDLADVQRTVKLANVNELAGRVAADIAVRTRMSAIDRKQYDRISARGTVDVSNLTMKGADLPHPLAIEEASLQLTPQRAELRTLVGMIGSSDVRLSGFLENLVPFAFRGDDLRGSATFASRRFNLDEWQSDDSLKVILVPANIDFALQATVDELTYAKLKMTDAKGGLRIRDQRATLESFTMSTLGGELGVTGFYETTNAARPTFDVDVRMRNVDIPSAFSALTTVQMLAPVAKFARGNVSTDLHLSGPLDKNMMPVFAVLDGKGALRTSELVIQGLPLLGKLADALKLDRLRNPTLDSLRASIRIEGGRVHLSPFNVRAGQIALRVAGSHGIDQTMQYTLGLRVPRSELGTAANQVIASLASRAGKAGLDLQAADAVELDVKLGGTLTNPTVQTNLADVVASTAETVKEAAQKEVAERVDSLKARADSAADEARRKAQAEAERLIAEAEQRGAQIKAEAEKLAETVRREGAARADTLVARASSPLARAAARPAADRLKKEANDRADQIIREADKRANDLVAEARRKAAALGPG